MKHKRGRSTHYFWTAESAVLRMIPDISAEINQL
jgi:hypothetical protein